MTPKLKETDIDNFHSTVPSRSKDRFEAKMTKLIC